MKYWVKYWTISWLLLGCQPMLSVMVDKVGWNDGSLDLAFEIDIVSSKHLIPNLGPRLTMKYSLINARVPWSYSTKILLRYLTLMPKISLANMQNRVWILPFESIRWQTIRKTRWVLLFQNKYVVRRKTANCKSSLTNNKYNLLPNQQNWLLEMWLQRSFYLGCFQLGFHGILGPRQSKDSPRSYRSATIDSNF